MTCLRKKRKPNQTVNLGDKTSSCLKIWCVYNLEDQCPKIDTVSRKNKCSEIIVNRRNDLIYKNCKFKKL